ncbi:hypothetical protein IMF23_10015 [Chelatococcus daeguensis]|uniref:Uncharacterized protein n=1 Tax=Chelatococcus sambhunathii TaxID=363953 RepID=A0ABM9U3N5_9HYPH|nr:MULTISPECIES: hypothetical protein [Chelatococcus]MBM3083765.1 hypothetical protein [Chelatococcus daeguensis]CUA87681.1 hypothetical protein Ga0061061_103471 [Chelatococcus sambhunathii]
MRRTCTVVAFEVPYDDRGHMAAFCRSAFNWHTAMLDPETGYEVLATTTETEEDMRASQVGRD